MVRMLMLGVLELHETEAAVNEEMRTTAQVPCDSRSAGVAIATTARPI
jgi:hypothetical protein